MIAAPALAKKGRVEGSTGGDKGVAGVESRVGWRDLPVPGSAEK